MASDSDYMSFLDKANQDPSSGKSKDKQSSGNNSKGGGKFSTQSTVNAGPVPDELHSLDAVYESEADEPFEPVAMRVPSDAEGKRGVLDEATFAATIGASQSSVEALSAKTFDPKGRYGEVRRAVKEAAGCDSEDAVKVFRVAGEGARAEYWVVALQDGGEGQWRVVGVRARAVES